MASLVSESNEKLKEEDVKGEDNQKVSVEEANQKVQVEEAKVFSKKSSSGLLFKSSSKMEDKIVMNKVFISHI